MIICLVALIMYRPASSNNTISTSQAAVVSSPAATASVIRFGEFDFIRPVLYVNGETTSPTLQNLKVSIDNIIHNHAADGLMNASIYIQKFDEAGSLTINPDEVYDPGSMMKVSMMIACLKEASSNRDVLTTKILFKGRDANMRTEKDATVNLTPGKAYTVKELIEVMIEKSDNDALLLLSRFLDPSKLNKVYHDLNIHVQKSDESTVLLSVKDYAKYLNVLYNASYLNRDDSQWALRILSKSTYNKSITRTLPEQILVAHKYGISEVHDKVYLGEGGIFYSDVSPYMLVVMTKGKNQFKQSDMISEISDLVFKTLNSGS